MDNLTLLGRQRAEFQRAESFQFRANVTEYLIAALGVIALLIDNDIGTYMSAVVDFVLLLAWQFFLYQKRQSHNVGERARRALLISHGLGIGLTGKAFSDLVMKFKSDEKYAKKYEDPEYFASIEDEPGPQRLARILEESVFWSKHLFAISSTRRWWVFVFAVLFAVVALLLIPTVPDYQVGVLLASVFCVLLSWLATSSILTSAIDYSEAATSVDDIEGRLQAALSGPSIEREIWPIFGDYNATLQDAPTIPSSVYERHKDRLSELWLARQRVSS